jgi:hypothetical protein
MVKRIALTEELPEIGDARNSPLTKNGSLASSVGTNKLKSLNPVRVG